MLHDLWQLGHQRSEPHADTLDLDRALDAAHKAKHAWGRTSVAQRAVILPQFTVTGYDASCHMSEETVGASGSAAKGIWQAILYSAIGGWILLLSFLFAVQDAGAVTASGGSVVTVLNQALGAPWIGIVLVISTVGQCFCAMACMTSMSFM